MTRFKRWLTYAPATTGLPLGSSPLRGQRAPGSVSGRPLGPPSAQSPFARRGCYPRPSGVPHRFDQRYPVFVAPTGSCARPKPSRRFRSPYTTGLRRLRPAPAGRWSFPTLFPAILVWVLGPLPRGALQVRLSVPSLETPVFAPRECARRTKPPRTAAATRYLDFGAVAIPFPFRPPHSLDLQAAPTAAHLRAGRPGRLHHASPGWLPAPGCGIASCPTRTIDTAGLPPAGLQLCRLLRAGSMGWPGCVGRCSRAIHSRAGCSSFAIGAGRRSKSSRMIRKDFGSPTSGSPRAGFGGGRLTPPRRRRSRPISCNA